MRKSHLFLDAGRSEGNSVKDGGIEHVESRIDLVPDIVLGLLHEFADLACRFVENYHTVFRWLFHLNLSIAGE